MKIAIIGTGVIGTSLGLALRSSKMDATVVGSDERYSTASKAGRRKAFDKTERRLLNAVDGADLVILSIPVVEMREIMEIIGPELPEGCVVTDTGSTKEEVISWAEQYLPRTVHFVGGHPLVWAVGSGPEYAMEDLFKGHPYCVVPSQRAGAEAVRTVVKMIERVGAKPYYMNADEHDSYAAGVSQLPAILSAALVKCTSQSPSWVDISKLAEIDYSMFTILAAGTPEVNRDMCVTNTEKTVDWIDRFIGELVQIRELLASDGDKVNESLRQLFDTALEERLRWTSGKVTREYGPAVEWPTMGEMAMELVVPKYFLDKFKRGLKISEEKERERA